jgi:hypothetical protein
MASTAKTSKPPPPPPRPEFEADGAVLTETDADAELFAEMLSCPPQKFDLVPEMSGGRDCGMIVAY